MSNLILFIGFTISVFLTGFYIANNHYEIYISECEAELPRNQYCEIVAVPREIEND